MAVVIGSIVAIVAALLLVGLVFAKNYKKVPNNRAGVFVGRGKRRVIVGGAGFRMPVIERYDEMSLEPFSVDAEATDVRSVDNVPVYVQALGLIKFGSSDDDLAASTERYLTTSRETLLTQVTNQLAGSLRNIVSQMTLEELNSNREEFRRRVIIEAEAAFKPIGMQLDGLTIQKIKDDVGYLDALGRTRTAQVKSDATIGEANAKRDADIQSADARRAGEVAQAEANAAIAQAQRDLELKQAAIQVEVDAAKARASQAGPLADAEARRKVELAGVETEQQRTQAQIEVERQRVDKSTETTRADVVVPAEAARQAAVLRAQGDRDATIAAAEADAKQRELSGTADAQVRTINAEARRVELAAEAAGQRELADALREMDDQAIRVQFMPKLIEMLPLLAREFAAPLSNIDRVTVVDGGNGGSGNGLTRFAGSTVAGLPQIIEMADAVGIDLSGLLGKNNSTSNGDSTADAATSVSHPRA